MKYTIISLNDERKSYKDAIRSNTSLEEVLLPAVDGKTVDINSEVERRGLFRGVAWSNAKIGELGVWLSNYDRWKYASEMDEPLVVFEDDAIIPVDFDEKLQVLVSELPEDWDFVALWVPENQRQDFLYNVVYNENGHPHIQGRMLPHQSRFRLPNAYHAALVYQGYGMVSLMYSPQGGQKLINLAKKRGIDTPVDCWIYEEAHKGNLNGYAPRPEHTDIVQYDWSAVSHVQLTERAE